MAARTAAPQPEERRSTEWAHSVLRERILNGELAPGEPIAQAALAGELGISRTPLREAMRLLQNEGLLEGEPNRRLRVTGISTADLEQLYAMRIANECLALRASAPSMSDADVEAVRASKLAMEEAMVAGDVSAIDAHHRAFHRALIVGAGERFTELASLLWDHTTRYRAAYMAGAQSGVAVALDAQADHSRILEAVAERDGATAAVALAEHYARTAEALIASNDPDHVPVLLREAVARVRVQA